MSLEEESSLPAERNHFLQQLRFGAHVDARAVTISVTKGLKFNCF